jgi:hypothetical protein
MAALQIDDPQAPHDPRRVPLFARTLFRHLQEQGYSREQIIGVSSELLSLLSSDIRRQEELPAE